DYTFYTFHILGIENTHISDIATKLIKSNSIMEVYVNRPDEAKSFEMKIRFTNKINDPETTIKRAIGNKYEGIRIIRKL
ncbi:MAG: hypothetical protein M1385_01440, partial [Candidatus Marsarchaeota archaeon]|nr:hypothetical protein [Candidatus Marsarchaeota archaeon]